MSGVNKAILIGNLGADPELRYTQSKKAVVNFTVATSRSWNDKEGEKQEETEWHRVVAWDKLAEICSKFLKKGSQVYIEGRMQTRSWTDKEGVKRYTTEIVAHEMSMLGKKDSTTDKVAKDSTRPAMDASPSSESSDELPF